MDCQFTFLFYLMPLRQCGHFTVNNTVTKHMSEPLSNVKVLNYQGENTVIRNM